MATDDRLPRDYEAEIEELQARLQDAEETLRAIQSGEVDALVITDPEGEQQVYTLKGEERTYRILIESMNEGAIILTAEGTVMYANCAFAQISGMPLERVIGSHVRTLATKEDAAILERLVSQNGGITRGAEVTLINTSTPEGIPVYLSFGPIVVDETQAIAAVVTDLTERKRAEAEIRQYHEDLEDLIQTRTEELHQVNEEIRTTNDELQALNEELNVAATDLVNVNKQLRTEVAVRLRVEEALKAREQEFRAVFDATQDAIVIVDDDGVFVQANPSVADVFGLPQSEIIGRHISEFLGANIDFDKIWPVFMQQGSFSGEHEIRRADGVLIHAESRSIANIQPGRHLSIIRDITERKRQMDREHHIAEVLQEALVPDTSYDIPGCDIAIKYKAALEEAQVGGDFYDIFELGNDKIGVLVGDVAGKGLPAAIRVAAARHSIRSYAYLDPRPSRVVTLANEALCRDDPFSSMLTVFFAIIDVKVGIMTYANGGHEVPLLRHKDGHVQELAIEGRALGVECGYEYSEATRILAPGDILLVVTDGITEARPNNLELFGIGRVRGYMERNRAKPLNALVEGLLEAAKSFSGGNLKDDAVVLAFSLTGEKP